MEAIGWVVGVMIMIGIGLLLNSVGGGLILLAKRLWQVYRMRTSKLYAFGMNRDAEKKATSSEEEILGLSKIPWINLYIFAGLGGAGLFVVLAPQTPGLAPFFLVLPGLVYAARRYMVHSRRRFITAQVRQLMVDARLRMSLFGSLLLGLENIATTTNESSLVYRSLKKQFAGGSPKGGLDVLANMARELKSKDLERVVQRIRSAQMAGGVLDMDTALGNAIEEMTGEMNSASEEQLQKLPLRLTMLAMPFLLTPIIVLLFYPLVARVLGTLSGMSMDGGF